MTEPNRFSPFARLVRLVILAFSAFALIPAHAAQYMLAPPPAWVVPRAVPEVATDAQTANSARRGELSLLSDTQVRIEPDGISVYKHFASKALDGRGVHGIADMSIEFDPSYEKLTLHAVTIVRGGRVIDKLRQARIQVLQRERELEYRILDGSRTLSVILDDVRVGDTVEYAYSRSGVNPALRNRLAGASDMQWAVPVARVAMRVLVPQGRQLAVGLHGSSLQPTVREVPGFREYQWTQDSVPALRVDDGAPSDYDPYPFVYWSDFADWESVVQWALPLYRLAPQLGPELNAVIAQVRQDNQSPEARLQAVLRLVQRDIRYFGVEAGQGGYIPRPPDLVYKRRFGDCKDKALLMVAMLRAVGVDAAPALVNTTLNGAIQDRPPGPGAFDHVVVRATIGDNTYWLDPTRSSQNGTLGNLTQADFGMALVLAPDSKRLVSMRNPAGSRSFKAIHAVFDARAGLGHPVAYSVTTTFSGAAADRVRAFMSSRSRKRSKATT